MKKIFLIVFAFSLITNISFAEQKINLIDWNTPLQVRDNFIDTIAEYRKASQQNNTQKKEHIKNILNTNFQKLQKKYEDHQLTLMVKDQLQRLKIQETVYEANQDIQNYHNKASQKYDIKNLNKQQTQKLNQILQKLPKVLPTQKEKLEKKLEKIEYKKDKIKQSNTQNKEFKVVWLKKIQKVIKNNINWEKESVFENIKL